MRKSTIKAWLNAGVLLLLPLTAYPAGLGKLTVTSALGQPLRGEIELLSVQKGELDALVPRLASAEAFKDAKIERSAALLGIRFSIEQNKAGVPLLKLSTSLPVNEPFLDMLIELNWPAGRLVREYTVLLDPPGYAEPTQAVQPVDVPAIKAEPPTPRAPAAAVAAEPSAPPAAVAPAKPVAKPAEKPVARQRPEAAQAGVAAPGEGAAQPADEKTAAKAAEETYGPVKKGETLSGIAKQLTPEGHSLEQMLVALYQSNRQAFAGKNMNRLKTGQILQVPEASQVAAVDKPEAVREIKAHAADWNAYRQKLAAAVTEAAPAKEEAPKQSVSGKITTAVEDKAAPARETSKDVLKLSKGESPAGSKDMKALQERLHTLQEEATAREKSIRETNERIAALEKNIREMQQLLEIKDKNLAELQKQAAAAKPEAPKAAEPTAEKALPARPEAAKPAEAAKPTEAPKPPVKKPAEAKPLPAPAPKQPEPSLLDDLLANPLYLAGGGAALILTGLLGFMALGQKRKKNLANFEDSIMTGGELKVNTVLGETAGGVIDTGDTSFLTDFSQIGMGTIDTNDVDPIAEAEVYMAYGRDAQAEEILKESLLKDPTRHEIYLKLLEIYAGRKNLLAFETLAGELYAATGDQNDPVWLRAAEMGRALDPNNPLFSGKGGASAEAPAGGELAELLGIASATAASAGEEDLMPGAGSLEATPEDTSPDLDFNLEETAEPQDVHAAATEQEEAALEHGLPDLDFSLGEEEQPAVAEKQAPEHEAAAEADLSLGLDFKLDEVPAAAEETPPGQVPAPAAPADNVLEFNLGSLVETPAEEMPAAEAPAGEAEDTGLALDLDTLLAAPETAPTQPAEAPALSEFFAAPEETPKAPEESAPSLDALTPDFALPEESETAAQPSPEEESIVIESAPAPESGLSFDFELETPEAAPGGEEPFKQPTPDLAGISLELGEPPAPPAAKAESSADADFQEAATKLDLARAYKEMGDREGAREILEEVLKEGSPQQQDDARELLSALA